MSDKKLSTKSLTLPEQEPAQDDTNIIDLDVIYDLSEEERERSGIHHPSGAGMDVDPNAPKLRLLDQPSEDK